MPTTKVPGNAPFEAAASARLLMIDDHPIVLSGLTLLLHGSPDFTIVGEASDGAAARAAALRLQPDLIVTDLVMADVAGVALVEDLRMVAPDAHILVYSSHDETMWGPRAIRAGARGYVSKAESLDAVAVGLHAVLQGRIHVSATVQRLLGGSAIGPDEDGPEGLSVRERQVLRLIGGGATLQSLANELNVSVKTVGTYRERLKTKLGLDSVRLLERYAVEHVGHGRRDR